MPDSPVAVIPDISVIVITCNSEKLIRPCLDSIFKQECKVLEVILIDNGSQDRTIGIIKDNFTGVKLIENNANLGAAEARNQGIKLVKGKWVLALDCDALLEGNFFSNIINIIGRLPYNVGMLQPKILNLDRKTIYSCGIHLTWARRYYDVGSRKDNTSQLNREREIFGPCSAVALYSRKMLEEIREDTGYFDRRLFFLVEDVDLAWRARIKHWKCLLIPEARCYHKGDSSCLDPKKRQFLNFRNRLLMIKKNEGAFRYLIKFLPFILYDLPRFCWLFLTNPLLRKHLFGTFVVKNGVS